ncbi:ribose-5-phosphate isomerase [Pseudozyma hubeiensis SY62]|uniref:Ribose-5-phosphate isomerase n=1 Tax=Pseudozyma hubeiensis (strain SY62) TaxID=1305764 RepID=R9NXF3_PSEHS|nr:ribose-5-phosphate isomerase [Pseudozyma hubeiensis SY62]GAC93343.1 ribose-5-phosphate isomerase [Pseudozyma hubeiensis SY62]
MHVRGSKSVHVGKGGSPQATKAACLALTWCKTRRLLEHAAERVVLRAGVENECDNKTVKTQHFGENEDQDHTDEKTRLLSGTTHTGVTYDADGETSGETSETDRETSTELNETGVERHGRLNPTRDEHTDHETVDGNDTGHNDGNDTFDQEVRSKNTHGRDTYTGLGSTIRGTETSEDDGSRASHSAKEGSVDGAELRVDVGRIHLVLFSVSGKLDERMCRWMQRTNGADCRSKCI